MKICGGGGEATAACQEGERKLQSRFSLPYSDWPQANPNGPIKS
ncbi:MAG: hypothetical protein R2825_21975 [Saprospiraceae bacterium]